MKFTNRQIRHVLSQCGLIPPKGRLIDQTQPLMAIINAAMTSQNDEGGEPYTADNHLANEIAVLKQAQAFIAGLEGGD